MLQGIEASLDRAEGSVGAHVTRTGSRVFVRLVVRARFDVACARCLEPAEVRVDGPVTLTYVPQPLMPQPQDGSELAEDDLEMLPYKGEEIDLSDVVRDQVLLAIPMVALCRTDCRGLCPRCGALFNKTSCDCPSLKSDKPLARLGEIGKA